MNLYCIVLNVEVAFIIQCYSPCVKSVPKVGKKVTKLPHWLHIFEQPKIVISVVVFCFVFCYVLFIFIFLFFVFFYSCQSKLKVANAYIFLLAFILLYRYYLGYFRALLIYPILFNMIY